MVNGVHYVEYMLMYDNYNVYCASCIILPVVNPIIITDPMSQLSNNGDIVMFTCFTIAFPSPLYSWTTPIANSDFDTNTITVTASHSSFGNYTCLADSNGTIAESQPALLTSMPCYVFLLNVD